MKRRPRALPLIHRRSYRVLLTDGRVVERAIWDHYEDSFVVPGKTRRTLLRAEIERVAAQTPRNALVRQCRPRMKRAWANSVWRLGFVPLQDCRVWYRGREDKDAVPTQPWVNPIRARALAAPHG